MSQQDKVWWYTTGDRQLGPYSAAELKAMTKLGTIVSTDYVWREGLAKWVLASSIKGLIPPAPSVVPPPLPMTQNNSISFSQAAFMHTTNESAQKELHHSERSTLNPEISEPWKQKFELIEKAGGPKLKEARNLPFKERSKIMFNLLGSIFGPFYYLVKGMWKKAVVLSAIGVLAIIILELIFDKIGVRNSKITNFIIPSIFASRANIDYYKKMVLGDNGWW
ncbi:MAG: GYF domain-containing protein [Methylobacter sp.]|nr:GYF domain-containing protein [Methylobacter sp.]